MDLTSLKLLFSEPGHEALAAAQRLEPLEADYLRHFQRLDKRYPSGLAQAALETAILRREAAEKFPQAERMYFTRQALQQASPHQVSEHRAARYQAFEHLVDLACSIGSDTINMARFARTTGIDNDALRLAMAKANADALRLADRVDFIRADLNDSLPLEWKDMTGLFFDPARRAGGRRKFSVKDYIPPLEIISTWLEKVPALGVKISPGVNKSEVAGYDAELEFVSLAGELKEALLWFGPLKTARHRATILPGQFTMTAADERGPLPLTEPKAYIYEPDAAVIRAGLVAELGHLLRASQLDADIAYLTAEQEISSPFSRVWEIEDWLPFNIKRLREYMRVRGVGEITVKKRGSPLQPEEVIRMLRLRGENSRVLFLTHLDGDPIAIVCHPPSVAA